MEAQHEEGRQPALVAAMRRLRVDAQTARVVAAFDTAGIDSILFKGPSFERWLYGGGSVRTYVDTDLLVPPAQFTHAEEVLVELGYTRVATGEELGEPIPAHTFRGAQPGESVDLHHTLPGTGVEPAEVWALLWPRTVELPMGNVRCRVLDLDARAMHVAIHAAFHGARSHKQMEDLRRAVALLGEEDWRRSAELAARLRAGAAFATGLRLDPGGARVAAALGLGTESSVDLRIRAATAPPTALGIARLASTEGIGAKAALLAREAVPSRAALRDWSPLARRGGLGVAAAYALRPFWLLFHLPEALRAWRRAAREG